VRGADGRVENCLAIFSYQLPKSKENYDNAKIILSTLTDFTTLIEIAEKENYIKDEDKDMILRWKENPERWSA